MCHLGVEQGLASTAFRQIDREQNLVGAERNLPFDFLLSVGAFVERHFGGQRVGGDLADGAANEDSIVPWEGLGGHIALALSGIGRIRRDGGIAQQRPSRGRPGSGLRADRSRRFLDKQVDVGIAVPGDFHLEIADERFVDRRLEGGSLLCLAGLTQLFDRRLGEPSGPCGDVALIGGPLMGEHARAGPAQRRHIVGPGGETHADRKCLAIRRIEPGYLLADADRLLQRSEPCQVVGERQELRGACGKISRREQSPLHFGLGLARRFECHRQGFIHPWFGMPGGDGGRDEVGSVVVTALFAEIGRRDPQPCEPEREVALVASGPGRGVRLVGGLLCGSGAGREVAGDRAAEVRGLDDVGRQACVAGAALRPALGGSGERFGLRGGALGRGAAGLPSLSDSGPGVGDLEHAAAAATDATAHHAAAAAEAAALTAVDASGSAQAAAGLKRIDATLRIHGDHEVGHRVDLHDHRLGSLVFRRDHEHLVLDEIREVEIAEQQTQRGAERDARHVLRDRGFEIEPRVFEGLGVDLDGDALGVLDLRDHVAERRLGELEVLHRLAERIVDLLLVAAGVGEVDRLVLFAQLRDLAPPGRVGIDDRRLVGHRDRRDVDLMEAVHEAPLDVALRAHVFGVIVPDPGLDEGLAGEHAGRHRHWMVREQFGGLFHELLTRKPLGFIEHRGRGLVAGDGVVELSRVVAEHHWVAFGAVVADADAFLDEGVVAFGELLDAVFPPPEVFIEPHPFPSDGPGALRREVALGFFAGADDRLPDADFYLPQQPIAHRGVEVVRCLHAALQVFQVGAGLVGVGGHQLAGVAKPHCRLLFELLGPDLAQAIELGQLLRIVRDVAGRRQRPWVGCGRRQLLERVASRIVCSRGGFVVIRLAVQADGRLGLLQALECDRVHERRIDVVWVAPEGRHSEPEGRLVGPGGRSLFRQRRQLGGLVPDRRPGEIEPLAAEEWQEHAVGRKRIAEELAEVSVFLAGVDGRDLDDGRPGGVALGRALHGEIEPAICEQSADEQDGIAVGAERRQPSGQAAIVRSRRLRREHDVFGPEHGSDGEGPEPCAGVACRSGLVGDEQHAAGGVREGGEAGPVHLFSDADARHGDPFRAELFLECEEIGSIDAVEARPVADVDDGPARRRPCE